MNSFLLFLESNKLSTITILFYRFMLYQLIQVNSNIDHNIVLSLKTQQRLSVFGTCFDVSNIIISYYEYIVKIYKSGRKYMSSYI